MANFILKANDVFPVGTTVGAYANANPASGHDGAPPGTAVESQAIGAGGTATFTTLASGVPYVFAAQVSGAWRKVRARIADSVTDTGRAVGTGTTTSGSASVTSVTATSGTVVVGQRVAGPGIAPGSRVKSFSAGTAVLTDKATASGVGVALEFAGANEPKARVLRERDKRGTS